jgi:hypothetical protein
MNSRTMPSLLLASLALPGCITMNPSVVDPDAFLGARANPAGVYGPAGAPSILPVMDVRIDPIDRLFLVSFADDPVYEGVELQTFPRPDGEPDVRVLLWRPDTVDVYDSPGRVFDKAVDRHTIESLLSPKAVTMQRAEFEHRFNITEHGLDAAIRIRDREGRDVAVEVIETRGTPVTGGLIAPVGATSASPDYLPVFFLDEFALVKRGGTQITISVDGHARSPAKMTRLIKGPASYFTRYSNRVVIAHWNERREALLAPRPVVPGQTGVALNGIEYRFAWNGGRPEIAAAVASQGDEAVTFLFSPALPDFAALRPGARIDGRFVINVNDVGGVVAGEYQVERRGDIAHLVFQPLDAWQPPIVRGPSWVASYRYEADIDLGGDAPLLRSHWVRP